MKETSPNQISGITLSSVRKLTDIMLLVNVPKYLVFNKSLREFLRKHKRKCREIFYSSKNLKKYIQKFNKRLAILFFTESRECGLLAATSVTDTILAYINRNGLGYLQFE